MPKSLAPSVYAEGNYFATRNPSIELVGMYNRVMPQRCNVDAAWLRRGEMLANLGLYHEALESFNQAIATNPNSAEAWVFQGVLRLHLDQPQTALECCDRALAIDSNNREAWAFRGVALTRLGHCKLAYASYSQATNLPQQHWWQRLVGWLI